MSKIRYRYNQAPHLTHDTNGKVTTSQLDITIERHDVSPFPAGDHKASVNRRARKRNKNKTEIAQMIHKNTALERSVKYFTGGLKPVSQRANPFNSTSRYLDDLLNIDNSYFEKMVGQIYPTELQLNKANASDTEAPFLNLNLSITDDILSSKIYDKWDDFDFKIVNFPFLDADVPRSPSYGVYISQFIRFARVCLC